MKAKVADYYTDILLEPDEFKELCRPGEGANTCIWALVGPNGFECCYTSLGVLLIGGSEAKPMRSETGVSG